MIVIIEVTVLCILFTFMVYIMSKNPIKTIYNYPPKIQERVKSMEEYMDKIPSNKNKIFVKFIASIVIIIIISLIMRYINKYNTFKNTFIYSYIIWTIVNLFDALIIDCVWFCHDKRFIIRGTEDMEKEYHNYWFHIKGALIGQIIGLIVCIIVGIVVTII